jgi:hypothetical protein
MTDTTTVDEEHGAGTGADVPPDEHIAITEQIGTGEHQPVKDRLLLPLLVPLLSAIAVGTLAVNISRIFLAGSSEAALLSAIFITVAILGGASLLAAAPRMRTSSLAMVTGLVVVIIVSGGLLTLGPSLGHGEEGESEGYVEPEGAPVANIAVEALTTIKFDAANYDTAAGVVEVSLTGAAGHTLAFRDPELSVGGFELGPTPDTPPLSAKFPLTAGETYEIYCTITGHAPQGMVATITVAGA